MRKAVKSAYLLFVTGLLSISAHPVCAEKASRPFVFADVDGDGQKDGFYRIRLPDRVELGVRLTKHQNKYVIISRDEELKDGRNSTSSVEQREKFLERIRCHPDGGCPGYRREAIAIVEKSKSPQVVIVGYEFTAKALLMDEKGNVVEAWYSD